MRVHVRAGSTPTWLTQLGWNAKEKAPAQRTEAYELRFKYIPLPLQLNMNYTNSRSIDGYTEHHEVIQPCLRTTYLPRLGTPLKPQWRSAERPALQRSRMSEHNAGASQSVLKKTAATQSNRSKNCSPSLQKTIRSAPASVKKRANKRTKRVSTTATANAQSTGTKRKQGTGS